MQPLLGWAALRCLLLHQWHMLQDHQRWPVRCELCAGSAAGNTALWTRTTPGTPTYLPAMPGEAAR